MIYAMLVRFSEDPDMLTNLVLLEGLGEGGVKVAPRTCVQRAVWGMMYADDAGLVSNSA